LKLNEKIEIKKSGVVQAPDRVSVHPDEEGNQHEASSSDQTNRQLPNTDYTSDQQEKQIPPTVGKPREQGLKLQLFLHPE